MNETDCMSCRARNCGRGDVIEYNRTTGTVVECRACGFKLNREERDAIAAYYENAAARAAMARDVAWCEALRDCGYPIARVAGIALGVDGVAAASVAEAATFGEDIADAIRAAKPEARPTASAMRPCTRCDAYAYDAGARRGDERDDELHSCVFCGQYGPERYYGEAPLSVDGDTTDAARAAKL